MTLPIVDDWFQIDAVAPGIWRLHEPHVVPFMQANLWLIAGRDRWLLVDGGNGVAPLAPVLRPMLPQGLPLLVVATHGHADHIGALSEWPQVWAHASLVDGLGRADPDTTLAGTGYGVHDIAPLIVPPPGLTGPLVTALPRGFDPARFGPRPIPVTRALAQHDTIDLGDRIFQVHHVPGHSPGCIALHDPASGLVISGDALYDGGLVDNLHHSDRATYRASLARLDALAVTLALGGHGPVMTGPRWRALIAAWLQTIGLAAK